MAGVEDYPVEQMVVLRVLMYIRARVGDPKVLPGSQCCRSCELDVAVAP